MSRARVSWREWAGLGAGLLAAVSLLLPWSTLSASAPDVRAGLQALPRADVVRSAWKSDFLAWAPPVLLVVIAVLVVLLGRREAFRRSGLPSLWLVGALVVLLLTVLGWLFIDLQFGAEERQLFDAGGITVGAGTGRYLGLAAVVVSVAVAFLDVRAARAEARTPMKVPRRTR